VNVLQLCLQHNELRDFKLQSSLRFLSICLIFLIKHQNYDDVCKSSWAKFQFFVQKISFVSLQILLFDARNIQQAYVVYIEHRFTEQVKFKV
jgi:hypothetical protein